MSNRPQHELSRIPQAPIDAEEAPAAPRKPKVKKLFVLDTNVLMHDPTSLFRFEEHDVYLPIGTLEELDSQQEGPVRRLAQRAPGEPLPRRDRLGRRTPTSSTACRSRPKDGQAAEGAPVPADRGDQRRAAARRCRSARPTTRSCRWCATCRSKRAAARGGAGVEGHQHAHQGARARPRRRGLLQRQGAGGRRPPLHRRARAAGGLLEHARPRHGVVEEGRPHLLPRARPAGAEAARQRVRLRRVGRAAAVRAGQGGGRPHGGARDAARLHPRQELGLGHHRAQPRAELRAQPADEPGGRLRHPARPGRHRQDAARARRRA